MKYILFPMMALALVAFAPVQADDTPLAEQMDIVNDSYKSLRRTDDAAEGAKLAREAQKALIETMAMTPQVVEKGAHPESKEVAMAAYKTQIAQALVVFCQIEAAFLAGDMEKVQELVKESRDLKKKGHDEFVED